MANAGKIGAAVGLTALVGALGVGAGTLLPKKDAPPEQERHITRIAETKIIDGDTFHGNSEEYGLLKIRMACIDTAEKDQPKWGKETTAFLKKQLEGPTIVDIKGKDRYERSIATVYNYTNSKQPININLLLVESGLAVVYKQFIKLCPEYAAEILEAEKLAKTYGKGFWADKNFVMPSKYRDSKKKKTL